MAKRRTGQRSVKRAFKKRRTIRKFRKTMRRYVQSGGINPAITLIGGLALAFVLEKSPKLMALLALLGMAEMPQPMRGGGLFGISLASAGDAARSITSKATETATAFTSNAQTKTIAVSKDRVINALNALKDAFKADTNADQITKCVEQLVAKINDAPASASAPENVTSEDITNSVSNADDTTQAPQSEAFDAMVKRVLSTKIDMLKTKYESAINARIQSFKQKYNLGPDDMNCINILKDAVLLDLIKKKNSLIDAIMDNPNVKTAIERAKRGGELLSAGADMLKGKMETVLQENPKTAERVSVLKDMGTAALRKLW